jgi:xanthine dehydrogenase YagS FAD-binding subunit
MRPFAYLSADTPREAIAASTAESQFLAGGTTLLDLMKLDVVRPERIIDINPLAPRYGRIERTAEGVHLGALVRMAEAADDPVLRGEYPVLAQALQLAASPQLRNMATLGGNVLQRTRCNYFRDPSYPACNKRLPGSGCAAIGGLNRKHAVLGVSENCIATYAGDFAQALIALDASVDLAGPDGERRLAFDRLHRLPAASPQLETTLAPGELITAFSVPSGPWTRRSLYLKIRDRESYAFALASAAVALHLENGEVHEARIGLGGVATVPWRAREAEQVLKGKPMTEATAQAAAHAAFAQAQSHDQNAYKPELGRRTLVRALMAAAALEV